MSRDPLAREEKQVSKHLGHIARFLDRPARSALAAATPFAAAVDLTKAAAHASVGNDAQPVECKSAEQIYAELAAMGSPLCTLFPMQPRCEALALDRVRPASGFLDLQMRVHMLADPTGDQRHAPWILSSMQALLQARPSPLTLHDPSALFRTAATQSGDEAVQLMELTMLTQSIDATQLGRVVAIVYAGLMVAPQRPAVLYGWMRQLPASALPLLAEASRPGVAVVRHSTSSELCVKLRTRLQQCYNSDAVKDEASEAAEWDRIMSWIDERRLSFPNRLRSARILERTQSKQPCRFDIIAHLLREALEPANASEDGLLPLRWSEAYNNNGTLLVPALLNCSALQPASEQGASSSSSASSVSAAPPLMEQLLDRVKLMSPAQLHAAGLFSQFDNLLFDVQGLRYDRADLGSRFIGHLLSQWRAWLPADATDAKSTRVCDSWSWRRLIKDGPAEFTGSLDDSSSTVYEGVFAVVLLLHDHGFRFDSSGDTFLRSLLLHDVLMLRAWLERDDSGMECTDWIVANNIATLFTHAQCKDSIVLEQTLMDWYARGGGPRIRAELSAHMIDDLAGIVMDYLTPPLAELLQRGKPRVVDAPKFVGFSVSLPALAPVAAPAVTSKAAAPVRHSMHAPVEESVSVALADVAVAAASATPLLLSLSLDDVAQPTNPAEWRAPAFVFNPFASFVPAPAEDATVDGAATAAAASLALFSFAAPSDSASAAQSVTAGPTADADDAAAAASPAASSGASPTPASLLMTFSSLGVAPSSAAQSTAANAGPSQPQPQTQPPVFSFNPFAGFAAEQIAEPAAAWSSDAGHSAAAASDASSCAQPAAATHTADRSNGQR